MLGARDAKPTADQRDVGDGHVHLGRRPNQQAGSRGLDDFAGEAMSVEQVAKHRLSNHPWSTSAACPFFVSGRRQSRRAESLPYHVYEATDLLGADDVFHYECTVPFVTKISEQRGRFMPMACSVLRETVHRDRVCYQAYPPDRVIPETTRPHL